MHLGSQLRGYTGGQALVTARGGSLAEVLADLDRQFPGLRFRVIDEQGRVRRHMSLFLDGEREELLDTPTRAGQQ